MTLIAMSSEHAIVEKRSLIKSIQAIRSVRKNHDDQYTRCGIGPFFGSDNDRDGYCQRPVDGDDDRTSAALEVTRPPVQRNDVDDVHYRQRSVWVKCDYGVRKPGRNVEGPVDWTTKPRTSEDADPNIRATVDDYHPVRRRLVEDCKRDETATIADDVSPEDRRRPPPHGCKQQWFSNCWLTRPSFAVTDVHQYHHRRVNRHRHHHHHTHHLHMWTSSCCWWLLVFYAVVVVIASFARAAHSAKDGKYKDIIILRIISLFYYYYTRTLGVSFMVVYFKPVDI